MNKSLIPFFLLFLFSCQEPIAKQQLSSVIEEFERQSSKKRSRSSGGGRGGGGNGSSVDNSMDERLTEQFMEISRLMAAGDYEAAAALSQNTDSKELSRLLETEDYEAAAELLSNILRNLFSSSSS